MQAETTTGAAKGSLGFSFFAHWRDVFLDAAKQWVADRAPTLGGTAFASSHS